MVNDVNILSCVAPQLGLKFQTSLPVGPHMAGRKTTACHCGSHTTKQADWMGIVVVSCTPSTASICAYVYFQSEPGRRSAAKPLANDELRRFAKCSEAVGLHVFGL